MSVVRSIVLGSALALGLVVAAPRAARADVVRPIHFPVDGDGTDTIGVFRARP